MTARTAWTGRLAAVAALAAVLAGCSQVSAPLPPGPQVVDVTMREYEFDYDASALLSGRVMFKVHNDGAENHRLALVFLPPDLPPLEEQVKGDERRVIDPLVDLPTMVPGADNVFSVGLPAGRWGLVCYYRGDSDASGASKGMVSEFQVR